MRAKRKITRKRNREWRSLLKKLSLFLIVFGITFTSLVIIYSNDKGLLSPLSFAKINKEEVRQVALDTAILKKELDKKKISYSEIKVSSVGAYMVRLRTGEEVILSQKKDIAHQLSSLQVIYSRLTMEGRGLRKLDLRYDKPVVVFK